jgi:hypothetical protein
MVFWFNAGPECEFFLPEEMSEALSRMNELRKDPANEFVTFASQDANRVGKDGVDSIVDGKTPDGHPYEWSKAGRAGKTRRKDLVASGPVERFRY